MKLSKSDAIKEGVIKPATDIKLNHDKKKVFKKGIVYDSFEEENSDILAVLAVARINTAREVEAGYYFSPLQRNFLSVVNKTALVIKAINSLKNKFNKNPVKENRNYKPNKKEFSISSYYSEKRIRSAPVTCVTDLDRDEALKYIFRTETKIVKKFKSKSKIEKIDAKEDGILYCKTRILEGQTDQD